MRRPSRMCPCIFPNRLLAAVFALFLIAFTAPLVFAQEDKPTPQPSPRASGSPEAARTDQQRRPEQGAGEDENRPRDPMSTPTFNGLRFRSIGPAFTSGRVNTVAVDPANPSHYFVAVASGGVW